MTGFPTQVQTQPAIAVAGDFSTANPRFSVYASAGALVAGSGLYVGMFAWQDPYSDEIVNSSGYGPVTGFMGRNQQGLITQFLAETSLQVLPGTQCFLYSGGDFYVTNAGANVVTPGMKAYANYAGGAVTFAASGSPPAAAVVTGSIAAESFSVTASIAASETTNFTENGIMTVTVVGSGTVTAGAPITGTGVQAGSIVQAQILPLIAGEALGGVGRYGVNIPQTTASTTISGSYGLMTVTAVSSGAIVAGSVLSGVNVTTGTVVTGIVTGAGGVGTYNVNLTQTAASATIDATAGVETKWFAMSKGQAGELIAISDHPLG